MSRHRFRPLVAGLAWAAVIASAARADDIEIFVGDRGTAAGGRPNVLFILDDSGSMQAETLTQSRYDPATTYPGGSCNADIERVYWSRLKGPPACDTEN